MGYDGSLKFDTEISETGFNKGITKLGGLATKGLAVLGGAMAGCVAAAVKVGASFEAEMSKVEAISGATGDDLIKLSEKAKEMGAKTKFSASESAQAMEYMAMAGRKTGDMLNGIEGIMNLAAASGEDLAATSDIVTDALTAFGLSAADSGHFADVLAQASSNANTNVGMMGETFKYVAPVAGSLGYSAEDTAVAIGLMANMGIKAGNAGTALRAIMARMAKPTDEVETAMRKLGISLTDSHGKMKSLDEVMSDLRKGFNGLSKSEKAQMAASIGGQEAMSGLLAIVNASDKDFNKLKDSIYNADGAAEKMAETMQNNLQGQMTILKSSAEGLGIEIYESIQKPLTGLAKAGIEAVNELTAAFKEDGVAGLIEAGGQIVTNLLLGIVSEIPGVINMAIRIIQSLLQNINKNMPQIMAAGIQILGAFIDGMVQMTPTIAVFAFELISQMYNTLAEADPGMLQRGYEILDSIITGFVQAIPKALPKVLDFIQGIGEKLAEAAPVMIQKGFELLSKLVEGIVSALPILISRVPEIISTFANIINDNFPTILKKGAGILLQLTKGIISAIPTLIANIPKIVSAIVDVIEAFNWLNLGKNIITFFKDGIVGMVGAVKNAGSNVYNAVKNAIVNLPSTLANLGRSAMYSLGDTISGLVSYAKTSALKIVSGIESTLLKLPSNMISIGKDIVKGLWNGISDMTGWIVSKIKGFGDSVLSGIKSFFGIHSPSRVFRDQVGKMLALGLGIGFEKNIPISDMRKSTKAAVQRLKREVEFTTSVRSNNTVGKIKKHPDFFGQNDSTDYDRLERIQMKAADRMAKRPIFLGTERIDRPLPEGAVPVW